jgi:hypothetical protein
VAHARRVRSAEVAPPRASDVPGGSRCADATLQEWMGSRRLHHDLDHADDGPGGHGADMIERAFARAGYQVQMTE